MKNCNVCKKQLDMSCFNKNRTKKDGYAVTCRECMKILRHDHYKRNKTELIKQNSIRKKEIKEWFQSLKANLKCIQCEFGHPAAIDFHHRDSKEKDENVSMLVANSYSKENIMKEIDKCDVLCANCHRILHYNMRT